MKTKDRDKVLRDLVEEIRRIKALPTKALPDDAQYQLITARNFLRAVQEQSEETPNG